MTKIKSRSYTKFADSVKVVKQPEGIDYNGLYNNLTPSKPKPAPSPNSEKEVVVKDHRKVKPKKFEEIEDSTSNIDKKSIIPIPGLAIQYENSESDWKAPTSDWVAPHGPQWGPMTQ